MLAYASRARDAESQASAAVSHCLGCASNLARQAAAASPRQLPESIARRHYLDLREFDRLDEGGHFAIGEVPAELAQRVRAFVATLR